MPAIAGEAMLVPLEIAIEPLLYAETTLPPIAVMSGLRVSSLVAPQLEKGEI